MKKVGKILVSFLFLIVILVSLSGCGNKKPMSASDFKAKMEEKGYSTYDATSQFSGYDYVKQVYLAYNSEYKIEFYELSDVKKAKYFYKLNKNIFKKSKGGSSFETNMDLFNTSKYTLQTGGKYKVLSRIGNTVLYVDINEKYKDNVKKVMKELGY